MTSPAIQIGDRERRVLALLTAHDLALPEQVGVFLDEPLRVVDQVLEDLARAGFVTYDRVELAGRGCVRITRAGLQAIGSRAAPPRLDSALLHSLGAVWLWVMAHGGRFGPVDGVWSAAQMRTEDALGGPGTPFAFPLDEFGGSSEARYPDLILTRGSDRIALELLLAAPRQSQLQAAMRACAADHRFEGIVYFTPDPRLGRLVDAVAASLDLTPIVHVRYFPAIRLS